MDPIPDDSIITAAYEHNYFGLNNFSDIVHGKFFNFLKSVKEALFKAHTPTNKFYRYRNNILSGTIGNFLDVGCATGELDNFLIKEFPEWKFFGIEPNKEAFNKASEIKNFSVINDTLGNAQYSSNYFDVILINHVLEHVSDPNLVIRECHRILKKGGSLIIAVPNFNSVSSKIFKKFWYHLDAPRHLFQFNFKALEYLLNENGFVIKMKEKEALIGSFMRSMLLVLQINPDNLDRSYILNTISILVRPVINVANKLFEFTGISGGAFIVATKK